MGIRSAKQSAYACWIASVAATAPSINEDQKLNLGNDNEMYSAFFQEAIWSYARGCGKHPLKEMGIKEEDLLTTKIHKAQKFLTDLWYNNNRDEWEKSMHPAERAFVRAQSTDGGGKGSSDWLLATPTSRHNALQ